MPSIEKQTVRVPESGLPEAVITAVDNGWVVNAGHSRVNEGTYFLERTVAAFESFDSMSKWLKQHLEDNTKERSPG